MAFTFFFRDAQTLELLIEQALPALCGQAYIRIWDAGCAHGPEAYTLAMMFRERMSDYVFRNVRIHATDVDPQFGPQIAAGVYAEQEVKRIPYPIRYRYFQVADEPGYVQVVPEIRAKVSFCKHDLLCLTPPREDFSLVVCKNVLLHFDEARRGQVYRMFHRALRPQGCSRRSIPRFCPRKAIPCSSRSSAMPRFTDAGMAARMSAPHRWIARLERSRAEGDSQSATRLAAASPADPRSAGIAPPRTTRRTWSFFHERRFEHPRFFFFQNTGELICSQT